MKFGKKHILVIVLSLVVCTAVYLNWRFAADETGAVNDGTQSISEKTLGETMLVDNNTDDTTQKTSEYFDTARMSRDKSKDDALSLLKEIAENQNNAQDERNKALDDMRKIAANTDNETAIENLAKAKGFTECMAVISDTNVSVVVETEGLKANEATIIKDICVKQTGMTADKVTVIPVS